MAKETGANEVEIEALRQQKMATMLLGKRLLANMSQMDVVRASGLSQSTVSRLEKKDMDDMTIGEVNKYMKAVGAGINVPLGWAPNLAGQFHHHVGCAKKALEKLDEFVGGDLLAKNEVNTMVFNAVHSMLQQVDEKIKSVPSEVESYDSSCAKT